METVILEQSEPLSPTLIESDDAGVGTCNLSSVHLPHRCFSLRAALLPVVPLFVVICCCP